MNTEEKIADITAKLVTAAQRFDELTMQRDEVIKARDVALEELNNLQGCLDGELATLRGLMPTRSYWHRQMDEGRAVDA